MNKSIAKNGLFYLISNVLNMLFPFLTSIYIARVLLPESIGEVEYARNLATYFSVFAFLGIPTYGMREISKIRDDRNQVNTLFTELFVINLISTIFFAAWYYLIILVFNGFDSNLNMHLLVGCMIVLNAFNVSWLYDGLEEFKTMTILNALFKGISFILMVVLIKSEGDVLEYAFVGSIGLNGAGLLYLAKASSFVKFAKIKIENLKKHLKPIILLFAVNISIQLYTLVDVTMIGALCTKEHVTYYLYASRINHVLIQFTTTIAFVLAPRLSFEYGRKNYNEFNRLITRGMKAMLIIAIPIIIGVQFVSMFLISAIYGKAFYTSGIVERILCLAVLLSPIGYLLGSRVLLIKEREIEMILCVSVGAVVNIICNCFFIREFYEYGAAIASVISEAVVMALYVVGGSRYFRLQKWKDTVIKVLIAGAGELGVLLLIDKAFEPSWLKFVIQVLGATLLYFGIMYALKEQIIIDYCKKIKRIKR